MLPIEGVTTLSKVPSVLERAKLGFVLALRQAFASSLTHPDLKYDTDLAKSKIRIYTAHPLTMEFFPCLVVSASSGEAAVNYLQDEYIGQVPDSDIAVYGGKVSFTMSITVITNGTLERERIIDHILFFLRHLFIDVFRSFDLVYTKGITVGGENLFEVDNKPVYEQTVSVPCYMEWQAGVDQNQLETVRRFIINQVVNLDLGTEFPGQ